MSIDAKVSRRTALKAGGAIAVAAAAVPYLAKGLPFSGVMSASSPIQAGTNSVDSGDRLPAAREANAEEPLVLMVKGDKVSVYQGTSETRFVDGKLSSALISKFSVSRNSLGAL
jgi:hypothetical protein